MKRILILRIILLMSLDVRGSSTIMPRAQNGVLETVLKKRQKDAGTKIEVT